MKFQDEHRGKAQATDGPAKSPPEVRPHESVDGGRMIAAHELVMEWNLAECGGSPDQDQRSQTD